MLALVIDDSRALRMILKRILVDRGFTAVEAGDGQQALDAVQAGPVPDLALSLLGLTPAPAAHA